jgi:two-component system invasion response regulator UvrY
VNTDTTASTITIVVVDDHPLASTGIARVLKRESDLDVAAICYGETESIDAVRRHSPDIIVFEFPNPRTGGPALLRAVANAHPDARVIVVGRHTSEIDMFRDAGAAGFVTTEECGRFLAACVRNVYAGATWIEYTGRRRRVSTPPGGQYIVGG